MATIRPKAVLYSAMEMPCASCAGLPPVALPAGACEPKISIMPITVPNRPISGAADAIVANALR